jgi:hypothetical protein
LASLSCRRTELTRVAPLASLLERSLSGFDRTPTSLDHRDARVSEATTSMMPVSVSGHFLPELSTKSQRSHALFAISERQG